MDSEKQTPKTVDVYQIVTDRIISLLEAGTIPWRQPWKDVGMPQNLISKRPYRGINLWLLLSLNYEQNLFLTWDQLKKIGGSVNQGEHGHVVVFWKNIVKKIRTESGAEEERNIALLRYYKVFNVAQCRDIPTSIIEMPVKPDTQPLEACEAILTSMPDCPPIKHKGKDAYYHVKEDFINMPRKKSFESLEGYYATLFHELVHSTGHEKRLNRPTINEMAGYGTESYSIEELIAEIGSAYLCSHAGILTKSIENSASYIEAWLSQLKGDKYLIISVSGHAHRAVNYILDEKPRNPVQTQEP